MNQAYLDCAASAPLDPKAAMQMHIAAEKLIANSSSVHMAGVKASLELERARAKISQALGVSAECLIFTSGGTEANNMAIKGVIWASPKLQPHVVISTIEHPSVHAVAKWLHERGEIQLTEVPVDRGGFVRPDAIERALRPETVLVSIMHANNETGAIQPIKEIGQVCRKHGIVFHTDACQSFLKTAIAIESVDLVTINAHKIHGPKGVGALYVRPGVKMESLFHGGGHEGGIRSGTVNVPAIIGFAEAVGEFTHADIEHMRTLTSSFRHWLSRSFPLCQINSGLNETLPNILNIGFPGQDGKTLFRELERRGIYVSTSSACHSTKLTPSPVLKAMGFSDAEANQAIRISVGRFTSASELQALMSALNEIMGEKNVDAQHA